ncbi:MAG: TonB-dependent receptor, partial [Flavisolibacter sp.]
MMKVRCFFLWATLLWGISGFAQNKFTINGYIRDSVSGESLVAATVTIDGKAVTSNAYGFYSLTLEEGEYDVSVSHVSYAGASFRIQLRENQERNIFMVPRSAALNEVVVYSKKRDANIRNAQMGKVDLSIGQIKSIPAFLGEVDILKAIQLLPGVQTAGEGNSGFYVRGGGPDQNLIVLDDAVVYNTGHLFGFFSIFNADAIKNTSLIKGGMPAQYGGRLSSVLDVTMKDGNSNQFQAEGGIGLIASRISLQGPVKKNKASFIVSARRTYIDALAKPFISKQSNAYGSGYYFYDLNAKINYRFSEKDKLFLSGYFGRDVFTYRDKKLSFRADVPWGNATGTLRWNHVFTPKLFANTTLVYNDYHFNFGAAQNNFDINLASGIKDLTGKMDFDYYPSGRHRLKFGGIATYHKFIPNITSGHQDSVIFKPSNDGIKYALENALYFQDDWDLSEKWKLNYGWRWSHFSQIG